MQENNFEKQVQQKMDELAMNPSAKVWQKLSVTIAKDKKDRTLLLSIFLLLLLLSTTLYFIFNKSTDKEFSKASAQKNLPGKIKDINPVLENKQNRTADYTAISEKLNKDKAEGSLQKESISSVQIDQTDVSEMESVLDKTDSSSGVKTPAYQNNLTEDAGNKSKNLVSKKSPQFKAIVTGSRVQKFADADFGVADSVIVSELAYIKEKILAHPINDLFTNSSLQNISLRSTTRPIVQLSDSFVQMVTKGNTADLVSEKKTRLKQKKDWNFGLNFSLGASTTRTGFLGIIGPGIGDESKAFADLAQNNSGGGFPVPVVYYPSNLKAGPGVLIGAFAQKSIGTRSSIVLGLNFKRLTSSITTGARVDSNISFSNNNIERANFYYRNGNQQNFNNHFYFAELPISIRLQLNKQNKVPVYLSTGISFARLIHSNALQFNAISGTYYPDNAFLNKTQFSGTLGVLFSLNAKSKNPFLLGPDIQYGFNGMANAGLYKSRHYSFIGLKLQKSIGKN